MKLVIAGCGGRICEIAKGLFRWNDKIEIVGVIDHDVERAKNRLSSFYEKPMPSFYESLSEAIEVTRPDGVMIGTRCNLHTKYALDAIAYNISMFLEKPVSITKDEALRLHDASKNYKAQAVCSFPLRVSPLVRTVKEILSSGKLGTIEHIQAVNNVNYGHVYYHNWYRDESLTGGLWLQKATHDFDYIMDLLGIGPVSVCAMSSKQIFKGDKPAGLKCVDCDEYRTCPESPFVIKNERFDICMGEYCCFATDTGNHDSGSAILRFPSGMHAVYSQNFFARKSAAKRGARLFGYKGTLEFDWSTDEITVISHMSPIVERYTIEKKDMGHAGGDAVLTRNFLEVCEGKPSVSPLSAGILSAWVCLHTDESDRTGTFQDIPAL